LETQSTSLGRFEISGSSILEVDRFFGGFKKQLRRSDRNSSSVISEYSFMANLKVDGYLLCSSMAFKLFVYIANLSSNSISLYSFPYRAQNSMNSTVASSIFVYGEITYIVAETHTRPTRANSPNFAFFAFSE